MSLNFLIKVYNHKDINRTKIEFRNLKHSFKKDGVEKKNSLQCKIIYKGATFFLDKYLDNYENKCEKLSTYQEMNENLIKIKTSNREREYGGLVAKFYTFIYSQPFLRSIMNALSSYGVPPLSVHL